ncbi:MAG: Gfo/Idh/MocA family oxidoreductase, partial [Lentisphaeria bacterium]|nr:Gfo/Idh/MocA family oxidoreductase [Lentisphaeria bacterium]
MAKATAKKAAPAKKAAAPKATAKKAPAKKAAPVKKAAAPKKLRVAFIGCGGIFTTHMAAYSQIPEVEIVGYCDIKPDRLEDVQKQYGATPEMCFEKWDDMFKAVKPDAIDVCTPNGVHMPAAVAAANAGCHVMVETPMAMTPEECEKMIAAAKKNNVKLAVGFQHRYNTKTDYLMNAKARGQFGNLMFVKCQALRRRGIPNWGVFGQKELQGGGPLIDIGVHVIEMAHYFMGSPKPVAATGNCWTYLGNK